MDSMADINSLQQEATRDLWHNNNKMNSWLQLRNAFLAVSSCKVSRSRIITVQRRYGYSPPEKDELFMKCVEKVVRNVHAGLLFVNTHSKHCIIANNFGVSSALHPYNSLTVSYVYFKSKCQYGGAVALDISHA